MPISDAQQEEKATFNFVYKGETIQRTLKIPNELYMKNKFYTIVQISLGH